MSKFLAFLGHPVTMAVFDVGRYAVMQHIMPALHNPTPGDIHNTASQYATDAEYTTEGYDNEREIREPDGGASRGAS